MKTEELETNLKVLYDELFEHFGLDKATGLFEDSKSRFSGYPYVGLKYAESKKKILFVGLDTGVDERASENTYHTFCSRRNKIPVTGEGETYKKFKKPPLGSHMAGTYLMALLLLSDCPDYPDCHSEWIRAKEQLLKSPDSVNRNILSSNKDNIPGNVLTYVAHTNIYNFVTVGRTKRSGNDDRRWRDLQYEIEFLKREIEVFHPDILVFQGKDFSRGILREVVKDFRAKYRVISGCHPSYRFANKVKDVQSLAEQR